jgi:hypothetical protein
LFRSAFLPAASLLLILNTSCSDLGESEGLTAPSAEGYLNSPYRVTVTPSTAALAVGDTIRFTAKVVDRLGRTLSSSLVSWQSSNPAVASIASTGKVTALKSGSAAIYATAGAARDTSQVTVTAPPPPPPPGGLAGECGAMSPAWIWCDDFDADRLASYFEVKNAGGRFARVSGVGQAGSFGMLGTYEAGTDDAGNLKLAFGDTPDGYIRPVDGGVLKFRDIYWRMFVRTLPGWIGQGGLKLSRAIVFADNSWAEAAIGHVWTPGTSPYLKIDPVSGTDASGSLKTTTYNDFDNFTWLGGAPGTTQLFSSANTSAWFCVEAHMRLNDAGIANGILEFWINQNLEARKANLNFLGAYAAHGINAIFFENYWNDGPPVAQSRVFDNIVVSTERIGCSGGTPGGTPPIAVVEIGGGTSVAVGSTMSLTATQKNRLSATVTGPVVWLSSNQAVATVDGAGVVRGVGAGTATIGVVSANGKAGSRIVTVTSAAAPPAVATSALPNGAAGTPYSAGLAATGGTGTYSWAITGGALPAGLSLSAGTGVITGTPTSAGLGTFTARVTSGGTSATRVLSITVGGSTGVGAPIVDVGFSGYADTNALKTDCVKFECTDDKVSTGGGANASVGFVLDSHVAPPIAGATKSMRYDFNHGGNGCTSPEVRRSIHFPSKQEVWAEFYVRWSPNFTTNNSSCYPNDHKLIFGDTEADLSYRWGFHVGSDGDVGTGTNHSISWDYPLGSGLPDDGLRYPILANTLWDGNWHVLRFHIKHSTTPTSGDGQLEQWIDGVRHWSKSGFNTFKPESNGGGPDRINGFSFGHNKDDGPPGVLMSIWWGRVRVWAANPGW